MVAAVPLTLTAFMVPHIQILSRIHRITLVASSSDERMSGLVGPNVTFERLEISRLISIAADVRALVQLWRLFRHHQFDLVQSITPKAGLLTMVAGYLAGVPLRVHWFTGQVWATKRGARRWFLKMLDRVLAGCSTHLLADSASQRAFLEREGVVRSGQVVVLGHGSVCGVNTDRFRPDPMMRTKIRARVGLSGHAVVGLYLGRLNRDKGLPELAAAFAGAAETCPYLHLLVVGPDEGGIREFMSRTLTHVASRVHFVDFTSEAQCYMTASDFFVMPSHREGFGSTVIEAGACGIPSIGTKIYGLSDALVDGESGILVTVGDVSALSAAMLRLATDEDVRNDMGKTARQRVKQYFEQAHLTAALAAYYDQLFAQTRVRS